jgi:hypothetical protein
MSSAQGAAYMPCVEDQQQQVAAFAVFDSAARYFLGISGAEFLERWRNCGFGDDPDGIPGVMEVASLIPVE